MKISAFAVTWNNPKDLAELLQSVKTQTRAPNELFVIDDVSIGACEAFNQGFKRAKHELIAFFDDDVVLKPDWFEEMQKAILNASDDVAVFSSHVVYTPVYTSPVKDSKFLDSFEGCASIIRKTALNTIGCYDERFFIYGNERDLSCRLLIHGFKIKLVPKAIAYHKRGSTVRVSGKSMYYHTRNELWNYLKHLPFKRVVRASLRFILKTFLKAYKHSLIVDYFRALVATITGLGYCIKRREVYDYLA